MKKDNWFSNFASSPIFMGDIETTYPTIEHAFQAAKSLDIKERKHIANIGSPGAAKKAGRKVKLRLEWDEIKLAVMFICLCGKFREENWYQELKLTGEEEIIEWNHWGDKIWGIPCDVTNEGLWIPYKKLTGQNLLGRLLMYCRNFSRKSLEEFHRDNLCSFDDTDRLKNISIELLKDISAAPEPSNYVNVPVDNHTLPSKRMKVAVYGNATKLNLDAQMRLGRIAELNAQIYLQRQSPIKNVVLKYLYKLNYTRIYYVDNKKYLNKAEYGLLLTNKNKPQKPHHKLCRVVKI